MINVRGNLAIRVISGRNGEFRVGKLVSEVGEFAIKSKLIEELDEGSYAGMFTVRKIYPSSFSAGGRITLEVRADLEEMLLDEVLGTTAPAEHAEPDPIEEERPAASSDNPPERTQGAPTEPVPPVSTPTSTESPDDAMIRLFGALWPLTDSVKLDPTIGRDVLRQQVTALKKLGYTYAPTEQVWNRK